MLTNFPSSNLTTLLYDIIYEAINGKEFKDIVSLKRAIDDYMNYYNLYRPHRTLNNQTPENFENLYLGELKKKSK